MPQGVSRAVIEVLLETAAQCHVALARSNGAGAMQALLTFAPLGHGQPSCIVTKEGA